MLIIWNLLSTSFLIVAIYFVKKGDIQKHKIFIAVSMFFSFILVAVFIKLRLAGGSAFGVPGAEYTLFLKILLPMHILAANMTFLLSLVVCYFGINIQRYRSKHKRWVKVLIPIWLFSSISGVVLFVQMSV